MFRFIAVEKAAANEIISRRQLQSIEFDSGRLLSNILQEPAVETALDESFHAVKYPDGLFFVSTSSSSSDFVVFDLEKSGLFCKRQSDAESLLCFQKVLRFAVKAWANMKLSPTEQHVQNTSKVIVWPYPISQRTSFRISIETSPDTIRQEKRGPSGGRCFLVYRSGTDDGRGPNEEVSITNFRRFWDDRRSLEIPSRGSVQPSLQINALSVTALDESLDNKFQPFLGYEAWLPLLTNKQRSFVLSGLPAPHRIEGPAGTGKSYTLAKIYRELFARYCDNQRFTRDAQFVLIDFNGEYTDSESEADDIIIEQKYKNIYRLSTHERDGGDHIPVSAEAITDPEFWTVFLEATEKTQMPFLKRAINNEYISGRMAEPNGLAALLKGMVIEATTASDKTIDRSVVVNLLKEVSDATGNNETLAQLRANFERHLKFHTQQGVFFYEKDNESIFSNNARFRAEVLDTAFNNLNFDGNAIGPVDEIRLQIILQYFRDIIRGFANREHLEPLIKRLDKRLDDIKKVIEVRDQEDTGKNITIISLRDVNLAMRKVLPLLICKKLYNEKKAQNNNQKYLNIIIDEAHNILSDQSERESVQWKDYRLETFEEIIKEGRKFGVFLTIASQRPADISATIISQLHNYFLHRLINHEDISAIRQTISYLDKVSFEYVPLLPTGTCIVAGLLANVPIVVDIGKIDPKKHEPKNKTITLVDKWN